MKTITLEQDVLQTVNKWLKAGWEYPDASVKAAIKFGVTTQQVHELYDAAQYDVARGLID
jgi:hypothetical protein